MSDKRNDAVEENTSLVMTTVPVWKDVRAREMTERIEALGAKLALHRELLAEELAKYE